MSSPASTVNNQGVSTSFSNYTRQSGDSLFPLRNKVRHLGELNKILQAQNSRWQKVGERYVELNLNLSKEIAQLRKENTQLIKTSHKTEQYIVLFLGTCCGLALGTFAGKLVYDMTKK